MVITEKQKQYLYSDENVSKLKKLTKETAKKRIGSKLSKETKEKKSLAMKKYCRTNKEERIRNLGKYAKGYYKGKKLSKEHKDKISKSRSGKKYPKLSLSLKMSVKAKEARIRTNKARSAKMRKLMQNLEWKAEWYKKFRVGVDRLNKNPDFQRKRLKAALKRPNKKELLLIELFKKHNLPFKYVGDGSIIIGTKNPDFINVNGKKQLIEHFGDYWHRNDDSRERIAYFQQFGFKTLIIWEHELKELTKVIKRVEVFLNE